MNENRQLDSPPRSANVGSLWSSRILRCLGRISAVLGAIAAVIAIWQVIPSKHDADRLLFSDQTKNFRFNSETEWANNMQGAHEIVLSDGQLMVPEGAVVSANHIRLQNGARITGQRFAVVATTIEGGSIEASGMNGAAGMTPGAGGSPGLEGGIIVVVAARISNTAIIANGGNGGGGAVGSDGADGRNGRCDGFGKWVKANPGGDGGPGGVGGPGGAGGLIKVYHSPEYPLYLLLQAEGGIGGSPGAGGREGTGGRGCVGLGGSQSNAQNGRPGINGQPGPAGSSRSPDIAQVPFSVIIDALDGAFTSSLTIDGIEKLLASLHR